MRRLACTLFSVCLLGMFFATRSFAAPGEVLSEQKISDTAGGFTGVLDDNDNFGTSIVDIGDLDGDGFGDIVVGADNDDDGGSQRGAVWVLFLDASGSVNAHQKISDTEGGFTGVLNDLDNFGHAVAPLGDLDGDGVMDIAVSAPGDDDGSSNKGAVWILFLNPDGTVKDESKISDGMGGLPSGTLGSAVSFIGSSLVSVGDLDGNGTPELACGSSGDDDGAANAGAVWIFFLLADGTVDHFQKISSTGGGFAGTLEAGDALGAALAAPGDLDGDGVSDLVVGAPGDDDGATDTGAVWLLHLDHSGIVKSEQKISATAGGFTGGLLFRDDFGRGVDAVGDLDGDSIADLIVGAPGDDQAGANAGAVWFVFLNANGTVKNQQKVTEGVGGFGSLLDQSDNFGWSVAGLGDLDGDGVTDVAVGARLDDDGGVGSAADRGAVWMLRIDGVPSVCGNAVLDPVEECDDANTADFDGCTATCETEDDLRLFGVADSVGLLSVTVDGVSIDIAVLAGDTPAVVAQLLANAINGDPTLMALGTTAQVVGNAVYTNGTFGSASIGAGGMVVSVKPGTVVAEQKISDTQGGFTGVLEDVDAFGTSAASLGDLDGDGVPDLMVGSVHDDDGGTDRGALWILFLNDDGTVKSHQKISDTQGGFTGILDDGDDFGASAALIGDLDGDGVSDIVVGAVYDDDGVAGFEQGAVWVLFLNADGTVKGHQKISDTQGGFSGSLGDINAFGRSVTSLGDLDGDGVPDLAVGAPGDSEGGLAHGAVWILFLNPDGTVKGHQKINDTQGGFTGFLDDSDNFGTSVASLGDLDDDGVSDLAVGVPFAGPGSLTPGGVWILFLNPDGTVKSQQEITEAYGGLSGIFDDVESFGISIGSLGDLDGDGIADLAVGATGDDDGGAYRGAVWILFLNSNGTVKSHQKISDMRGGFAGGLDDYDYFGVSVASLGDLDGNGIAELAVGAFADDDGGGSLADRGAVWIVSLDGAAALCGDTILVLPETCDDGNTGSGDGCYSTCQAEDEVELFGTAQGGTVQIIVNGIAVLIGTSPGQSAATVVSNLSSVVNMTPALQSGKISSVAIGGRFVTNGTIDSTVTMDAGIFVPEPGMSSMLVAGLLGLVALNLLRQWRDRLRVPNRR